MSTPVKCLFLSYTRQGIYTLVQATAHGLHALNAKYERVCCNLGTCPEEACHFHYLHDMNSYISI